MPEEMTAKLAGRRQQEAVQVLSSRRVLRNGKEPISMSLDHGEEDSPPSQSGKETLALVEEPVERGAADAELARGAQLVPVVEVEDEENVLVDYCVQIEEFRTGDGKTGWQVSGGNGDIFAANDTA